MSNAIIKGKVSGAEVGGWLREKVLPPSMLLLMVAVTVILFLYRDRVTELGHYGYLGAFLISLVTSSTIILPMPGILLIFALGASFNPFLVAASAAAGGSIGEMTGYMIGYSGHGVVQRSTMYTRAEHWMRRWGVVAVFVFALVPFLPMDLAGIASGVLRLQIWKFLLACWLGKVLLYIGAALAGAWGRELIVLSLQLAAPVSFALFAAVTTLALLALALVIENWAWKRRR